jgi:hypothetical protein
MIESETVSMSMTIAINPTNAMLIAGDLEDWAAEINNEHLAAEDCARTAIEHARRAGGLLIKAKQALSHGEWLPWLAANVRISERSVQIYMKLARANPQRAADLSVRQVLVELAAPAKPRTDHEKAVISMVQAPDEHAAPLVLDGNAPVSRDLSVTNVTDNGAEAPEEGPRSNDDVTNVTQPSSSPIDAVATLAATDKIRTAEAGPISDMDSGGWDPDEDAHLARAQAEYDKSIEAIRANPEMATALTEISRLTELCKHLSLQVEVHKQSADGYQNTKIEAVKQAQKDQRKSDRLQREVDRLKIENAALRKHIEILEGPP